MNSEDSLKISHKQLKARALRTIQLESESVAALADRIDDAFIRIVEQVHRLPGRVIITGIGKSAHIANKLVATLNSTGTPSGFMHAAEAIHGDLGLVQKGDLILCISKSGNSPEIKALVPLIKGLGHPLIAMTGQLDSYLATQADGVLDTTIEQEACPHNLAPTSSTAAQLAMGDALAMCLMKPEGSPLKISQPTILGEHWARNFTRPWEICSTRNEGLSSPLMQAWPKSSCP